MKFVTIDLTDEWSEKLTEKFKNGKESVSDKEAIKLSVDKWRMLARGFWIRTNVGTCSLCRKYMGNCYNCPVNKGDDNSEHYMCRRTPYEELVMHRNGCRYCSESYGLCVEGQAIAMKEVEFLEKLMKE